MRKSKKIFNLIIINLPIIILVLTMFRTGDFTNFEQWATDYCLPLRTIPLINNFTTWINTTLIGGDYLFINLIEALSVYYLFSQLIMLFFDFIVWIIEMCRKWLNGLYKKGE